MPITRLRLLIILIQCRCLRVDLNLADRSSIQLMILGRSLWHCIAIPLIVISEVKGRGLLVLMIAFDLGTVDVH